MYIDQLAPLVVGSVLVLDQSRLWSSDLRRRRSASVENGHIEHEYIFILLSLAQDMVVQRESGWVGWSGVAFNWTIVEISSMSFLSDRHRPLLLLFLATNVRLRPLDYIMMISLLLRPITHTQDVLRCEPVGVDSFNMIAGQQVSAVVG